VRAGPTRVQRIGGALQSFPTLYGAASLAIRTVGLARRDRQIAAYLASSEPRLLRIGSGSYVDAGWLSTDLLPVRRSIVYMDATRPFPLPDESFDAVQCEHVIEHVSFDAGGLMLAECHRVLRKGAVLRIATPNTDLVRRLLDPGD
jgi:SAM-dependent methyltransferase